MNIEDQACMQQRPNCYGYWEERAIGLRDCKVCAVEVACRRIGQAPIGVVGRYVCGSGTAETDKELDDLLAGLDDDPIEDAGSPASAANDPSNTHATTACVRDVNAIPDHRPVVGTTGTRTATGSGTYDDDGEDEDEDEEYAFPQPPMLAALHATGTQELLSALADCVNHANYLEIRDKYCGINIVLNERFPGAPQFIQAPRFRPRRKVRPNFSHGDYPLDQKNLSNDTQVLDMHWLYCRHWSDTNDTKVLDMMLRPDFNFETADEFVARRGAPDLKVRSIQLDDDRQWELASLQSVDIRSKWRALQQEHRDIYKQLRVIGRRDQYLRGQENDWSLVWLAAKIEQSITRNSGFPIPGRVAEWYQLLTGKQITRQSVDKKLRALYKRLKTP